MLLIGLEWVDELVRAACLAYKCAVFRISSIIELDSFLLLFIEGLIIIISTYEKDPEFLNDLISGVSFFY